MNFSSEYERDAEHEVDSTPTNDKESAVLAISGNSPLTNEEWIAQRKKEIKANWELEQQLKQRLALEGREEASEWWASPVSDYILFRTFGLHVRSWFSCAPLLAFEIYIQAEGISYRNEDCNKAFLSSFIYFT